MHACSPSRWVGGRGLQEALQDVNTETGLPVPASHWLPPRGWTAWPMARDQVPSDGFMRKADDAPGELTIRRPAMEEENAPSMALQEAVAAVALRLAKDKFCARPFEDEDVAAAFAAYEDGAGHDNDDIDEDDDTMEPEQSSAAESTRARSRSRAASVKRESRDSGQKQRVLQEDMEDSDYEGAATRPLSGRQLQPAVIADDEQAYDLLRPCVRHILSKLDATLHVLHNTKNAAANHQSESESDMSEASDASTKSPRAPGKRKVGRPRRALELRAKRSQSREASQGPNPERGRSASRGPSQSEGQDTQPVKKLGRPRKSYPRHEGETEKQFIIRIARLRKEPIPFFSDDSHSDTGPHTDASEGKSKRRRYTRRRPPRLREPSTDVGANSDGKHSQRQKSRARLGLRDWRDVLGAAAVAGFPQQVLDRAARRCADLFGQSLELRTLHEGAAELDRLVRYEPGMPAAAGSDLESDGGDEEARAQAQRHVRSASVTSTEARGRSRSSSRAPSRGRERSRSRSSATIGQFFCSVRDCPRNLEGFARRANLLRHLKTVHRIEGDALLMDVDSEDEMAGAVHVDGFLKPIKTRPGWRGVNARAASSPRKRVRRGRKRIKSDSDSEPSDPGYSDDSLMD